MAQSPFSFPELAVETVQTLLRPKPYFTAMPGDGGFGYPIFKAVTYSFVSAVISSVALLLSPLGSVGATGVITTLVLFPALSLIGLFISGAIMLVLSAICNGETKYQANVRAVAAVAAMMIVQVAIMASGVFLPQLFVIVVSWIATGYVLFLTYLALTVALHGKPGRAKILMLCIAGLYVLVSLGSWFAGKALQTTVQRMQQKMPPSAAAEASSDAVPESVADYMSVAMEEAEKNMTPEQKAMSKEYLEAMNSGDEKRMKKITDRMMAVHENKR